jgi:aquaporin Z
VGIGLLGVALAFGLTVLTMRYAIGHISGCHLNPAVSVGLLAGGRFPASDLPAYVIAQVAGGTVGAGVLYFTTSGKEGFDLAGGLASNGYGDRSPGHYATLRLFRRRGGAELHVLADHPRLHDSRAPKGFAPLAIGLGLTLIHLIGIPVTNLSVNPARSTGPRRLRPRLGDRAIVALLARAHPRGWCGRLFLLLARRGVVPWTEPTSPKLNLSL